MPAHLEFALKHDGVDLALLQAIFRACGAHPIDTHIRARPSSKYARLLGFFYELTTGKTLDPALTAGGNYVEALSPEAHLVALTPRRSRRWRVLDNLFGDSRFCPIIRRTPELVEKLAAPLEAELQELVESFPAELFQRASDYLYLKETRSSYDIEREPMPPADRAGRFVGLLHSAGEGSLDELLTEPALSKLQNLIVDPRYAAAGYRRNQNYVGEQRPDFTQRVHYICPPPQFVSSLVAGLAEAVERSEGLHAIVRATVAAFGFVFIHPFEDGNGRLHRFLIHDILHRTGFMAPGVILPVSATMLRGLQDYDRVLERYSRPLLKGLAKYDLDQQGEMTVENPDELEGYYRFPDLTAQAEYLADTVAISIRQDFATELAFRRGYDAARSAIREIVDMPDRRLDLLLRLLQQNQGRLARGRRQQFAELTDSELAHIELVFSEAFGLPNTGQT